MGEEHMSYWLPFVEVHVVDHCNHTCRWCHNYSPNSPKREYQAADYFGGLDLLRDNGVMLNSISLMGGEPFLHSNLVGFADDILTRYKRPLVVTSNGFWLSEDNILTHRELWPRLWMLKISRYPSIEGRLGGEENILPLFDLIRSYNPKIRIEWPDKFIFNELKFFEEPRQTQIYCGNSECLALVNLPDGPALGRCGAGAYAHLAPQGLLSEGFLRSKHMLYPLRDFELNSFKLWHKRYPLDACDYCNFSQPDKRVPWKPVKGKGLFVNEYEDEFERRQCVYLLAAGEDKKLLKKADALMKRNAEHSQFVNTLGVHFYNDGATAQAKQFFELTLRHDPGNDDARSNLEVLGNGKNAAQRNLAAK